MKINKAFALAGTVLTLVAAAACAGGHDVASTAGKSNVTVAMTTSATAAGTASGTSASSAIAKANVTFASMRARKTDGTWVDFSGTFPATVDVLSLVSGTGVTIASGLLPAGSYDQIEVVITAVSLDMQDGTKIDITLPQGGRAVVIAVPFEIVEGQPTTIKLRFEFELSFEVTQDGVSFHPEIEVEGIEHH